MAVVVIRDMPPMTIRIHAITEMDAGRFFMIGFLLIFAERPP